MKCRMKLTWIGSCKNLIGMNGQYFDLYNKKVIVTEIEADKEYNSGIKVKIETPLQFDKSSTVGVKKISWFAATWFKEFNVD